jgi:Sulfotransferase family
MRQELDRPVFVVGCGRSGTTLVGELLGLHGQVFYLNEPRNLWGVDPRTDVWGPQPAEIVLTRADANADVIERLREAFGREAGRHPGQRLVEKTPINCFRIPYMEAVFPGSLYVHVIRDGRDVAASIADRCLAPEPTFRTRLARLGRRSDSISGSGPWYGRGDVKWNALRLLALEEGVPGLADADRDPFLRGLVEWRLATTWARSDLRNLSPDQWVEFRYEDLQRFPDDTLSGIMSKLGFARDDEMMKKALERISDRIRPRAELSPIGIDIAGSFLVELGYEK